MDSNDRNATPTSSGDRAASSNARMIDRAWRLAFQVGFRAMRLWWRVRRPNHDGALVAVWHGGRVLMVRQSYRQTWTFPGGSMQPGENAREAACRELAEEVGLRVEPHRLRLVQDSLQDWEYRRDHVRIFELRLATEPALAIDNREIVAARFREPEALSRTPIPPHIRSYLAQLNASRIPR